MTDTIDEQTHWPAFMNRVRFPLMLMVVVSLLGTPLVTAASAMWDRGSMDSHHMSMSATSALAPDCDQHCKAGDDVPVKSHDNCGQQCCSNCGPAYSVVAGPIFPAIAVVSDAVAASADPDIEFQPDTRDHPPRLLV